MACSASRLQGARVVHTGPATSLCSSDICSLCEVSLPSSCPHKVSLLQPPCRDTCPPPRCVPDSYVSSYWLLSKHNPAPSLTGVSVITCVLSCECAPPCC
ncbi:keratin-associated protein 3-1-like [Octodon degus]|uniref:Keratin-associated protein 3-1-like n=1 Tax=Octodon degus TaxID=10160 RepID=A0A6P3FBT6_OCTDE|nr:keratin-associated protein 3-1-like [Octodon degus]